MARCTGALQSWCVLPGSPLPHVVGLLAGVQLGHRVGQVLDFLRRKQAREEQVAVTIKVGDLLGGELHGVVCQQAAGRNSG